MHFNLQRPFHKYLLCIVHLNTFLSFVFIKILELFPIISAAAGATSHINSSKPNMGNEIRTAEDIKAVP